ncbi:hypothetical protein FF38_01256 [Lucilia cuprina]|uniref:DUF4806 domain-containing protein n=1 Tax=Lucilia cuprina TaxID=7375 RepID=A0A0L0CDF4_LUCCU|nr:hypothetical protein FF38_01256 [Lucilia cuprina]
MKTMPKRPFYFLEEFVKFEAEVQNDEEKYNQLISDFEENTAPCIQNYAKTCWRKLMDDKAAQQMCWKGTKKKMNVRSLTVTQALKAKIANVPSPTQKILQEKKKHVLASIEKELLRFVASPLFALRSSEMMPVALLKKTCIIHFQQAKGRYEKKLIIKKRS